MRVLPTLAWLLPFVAVACAVPPRDPFTRANWSLQRGDLGGALIAYDSVPVAHARYPDARAGAVAVERSMRRCHELLLEALLMRSEWRDQEALATFVRAQALWPKLPGIDGWIAATRQRLRSLPVAPSSAELATVDSEPIPVPRIELVEPSPSLPVAVAAPTDTEALPVAAPVTPTRVAAPVAELPAVPAVELLPLANASVAVEPSPGHGEVARVVVPTAGMEPPAPPLTAAGNDPVALGLVDVETKLRGGQMQLAVTSLIGLSERYPGDVRVRSRLARLLQQRALLRYGQGAVQEAVGDWQRVLELEPGNDSVRRMLGAALRESQRRP